MESLSIPKMYYSMPINTFFIVQIHLEPYFADNPHIMELVLATPRTMIKLR
jgi:hypothetical protein